MNKGQDWKPLGFTAVALIAMFVLAAIFGTARGADVYQHVARGFPVEAPSRPLGVPAAAYDDTQTAQEWTAWAAISATAISFVSLLIIYWTLLTTRDMLREARATTDAAKSTVDATREIGQAQVRCYPTIDDITIAWQSGLLDPYISVTVRNAGNSPALAPELTIRANVTEYDQVSPEPDKWTLSERLPLDDISAQSSPSEYRLRELQSLCTPTTSYEDLSFFMIELEVCLFAADVFGQEMSTIRIFSGAAHVTNLHIDNTEFRDNSARLAADKKNSLVREHRQMSSRYARAVEVR